jgi:hypothetical protein
MTPKNALPFNPTRDDGRCSARFALAGGAGVSGERVRVIRSDDIAVASRASLKNKRPAAVPGSTAAGLTLATRMQSHGQGYPRA